MYKLLLVDDEPEIREGLREVIRFEEYGFEVVGEAGNGAAALQLAESLAPDLIITDIRMPLMDGLALCRRVRAVLPTTQFIILSGYDDFEYARQAIEVKVLGYLLKPISANEFAQMLQGARDSLDEAARQRSDVSRLRGRFEASLPLLRESLMVSLLSGGITPEEALRHAARYEENIQAPAYAVLMAQVGEETGQDRIGDPELLPFAVANIMQEVLDAWGRCYLFRYNGMIAGLLLLEGDTPAHFNEALARIEDARKTFCYYLQCELYIGVSTACRSLATLPAAARQAVSALDHAVLSRAEHSLCVRDVERSSNTDLIMDGYQLRQLTNYVKAGEESLALAALDAILDRCRQGSPAPKAYQTYLMELFMGFLRIVPDMSLEREDYDADFDRISKAVFGACPAVDGARELFAGLLRRLVSGIDESRQSSSRLAAAQAEQYLAQHYMREDLSLEDLCLHLHLSSSYFSAIFKKETKKTFHQYLTELRMDRALTLLSAGDLRTAQVAKEVGLPDPSYFSYCFKKHFGFPPSQARKGQAQQA